MTLPIRTHKVTRFNALAAIFYLCLSTFASNAIADANDVFNVVLATDYKHDSNLFRLDSGNQPAAPGAERWDNITRSTAGFKINKHYSLQTFRLDYAHIENKYQNAKFLDFNANDYKGAWLWAITPELTGNLSSEKTVALVPFLDFRATGTQNLRTTETQIFDFDWSPYNKWHLLGGYTKLSVVNTQTFLPETSFKFDSVEGGVKYSFPSQSYFALKFRNRQGENQEINFASQVGRRFTEKEEELSGFWAVTGKSNITSNIGHNSRTDDTFSIRDFSGYFGGVKYTWDISSKLNLAVDLTRKLSAFLDTSSSYTIYNFVSIRPTWDVTSKIAVNANFVYGKRKFQGDGPVVNATDRVDDMMSYGVGLTWTPRSTIKVGVNLQHDERDSSLINRDFSATSASINGQLVF